MGAPVEQGRESLWRKIPLIKQVVEAHERRDARDFPQGFYPSTAYKATPKPAITYRDNGEPNQ